MHNNSKVNNSFPVKILFRGKGGGQGRPYAEPWLHTKTPTSKKGLQSPKFPPDIPGVVQKSQTLLRCT